MKTQRTDSQRAAARAAYAKRQDAWRAGCEASYARRAPIRGAVQAKLQELVSAGYDQARLHQAFLDGQDSFGVKGLTREAYHEFWMALLEMKLGDSPEGALKGGAALVTRTDALRSGTYGEDTDAACQVWLSRWRAAVQVRPISVPRCNAATRANKAADLDFLTARQTFAEAA